jgi:hypothetical protein
MARILRSVRHVIVASVLVLALAVPFSAARATMTYDHEAAIHLQAEPVRFQFWIGPFAFELTIGGPTAVGLRFDGLR